jgi:flagellar L-ring protein precursor FlgH
MRTPLHLSGAALCAALAACSSPQKQSIINTPTSARPNYMASALSNQNPGSIYQVDTARLLYEEPMARHIGDTLTITIAENMSNSNTSSANTSQTTSEALKGPGALPGSTGGYLKALFTTNLSGSSSIAMKSSGQDNSSHGFTGTLTVSIIDILPNGNFLVGGDKQIAMEGNNYALRFSGIVNRMDIQAGNTVSSSKVADARIEKLGQGLLLDADSLGWMQRLFLSVVGGNKN